MIEFYMKYIDWCKKKLNLSDNSILWFTFIKGLIIGLLIYYFLII